MQARTTFAMLALVAACLAGSARAGVPSVQECLEGADFIANAARARDNGIERDAFLEVMSGSEESRGAGSTISWSLLTRASPAGPMA